MTKLRVIGLWRYPVKSCAGESVEQLTLDQFGPIMDRRWMVIYPTRKLIRQEYIPGMALIRANVTRTNLNVTFKDSAPFSIPLLDEAELLEMEVAVWWDQCIALDEGDAAAAWFSEQLGTECRLVRIGQKYHRQVMKEFSREEDQVGFADLYPLTLGVRESLDDLNRRIIERGGVAIPMNRFRPNIVVEGAEEPLDIESGAPEPNEWGDRLITLPEDTWSTLSINRDGRTETYRNPTATSRCPIPTIDQATGTKTGKEPLATLNTYRFKAPRQEDATPKARLLFCRNLIHDYDANAVPMTLKVGDILTAL
jgi:uncharacterized protein YcbX